MRIKRTCKICGDLFSAIKITQFFCSRKCFKRDYYLRTKSKANEEDRKKKFPTKACSFCEVESQLTFDPIESPQDFRMWGCPHCGATNEMIWENMHKVYSRQIIAQMLVTFQAKRDISNTITGHGQMELQVYHIPMSVPEQGNQSILVLACELMDMLSIQKQNRKKILFS